MININIDGCLHNIAEDLEMAVALNPSIMDFSESLEQLQEVIRRVPSKEGGITQYLKGSLDLLQQITKKGE